MTESSPSETVTTPALLARRISRRPHKKSRNGCENCKKRRIKCLEEKPECSNCLKHSIQCSFAIQPPSQFGDRDTSPNDGFHAALPISSPSISVTTPSTLSGLSDVSSNPKSINIIDLELLHNYNISTSYTLANVPEMQNFLRVNAPRIAFTSPFLMHGLLAVSALHLAHYKKGESQALYLSQAREHHEAGLRVATSLLRDLNDENTPSVYIFTMICAFCAAATGPKPGDFLFFSINGLSEWLILFRGMRNILNTNFHLLRNGVLAPLFQISIRLIHQPVAKIERLQELRDHLLGIPVEDPNRYHYLLALDELEKCFPAGSVAGIRSVQPSPQVSFMWAHQISDEFVDCLQARKPQALVVLAQFCVLLHDMSSFWWMKGWAEHLLSEIYACLAEEHRIWLRWPMEEIGWLPG